MWNVYQHINCASLIFYVIYLTYTKENNVLLYFYRNRKEYKCAICPKSFNQRVAYNMHMRIHTGGFISGKFTQWVISVHPTMCGFSRNSLPTNYLFNVTLVWSWVFSAKIHFTITYLFYYFYSKPVTKFTLSFINNTLRIIKWFTQSHGY